MRQVYRAGQSIPAGHMLGRISGGTGPAEIIPLPEAHYAMAASGYERAGNAGGSGFTTPLAVALGGTGASSASGTAVDNISGFSGTGIMRRTGAGTYTFGTAVGLTTEVTGTLPVGNGGLGIAVGTSGGIPAFTGATTITSSGALTATCLVLGGGAGAVPTVDSKWKVTSSVLIGNANAAAIPAGVTGTQIQIGNADGTSPVMTIDAFATNGSVVGRRANNTAASPTALASGDSIFNFAARGHDGSAYSTSGDAQLRFLASENWTSGPNHGTKVDIRTTATGGGVIATVAEFKNAGCSFQGTTTNDDASSGFVGEYVTSVLLIANEVSLTTGTAADVTSISLTAGDWDVWGEVWFDTGAGTLYSIIRCWISPTSATLPTVPADGTSETAMEGTSTSFSPRVPIAACRATLASTTTYYLGTKTDFSVSTAKAYGKLCARRRR